MIKDPEVPTSIKPALLQHVDEIVEDCREYEWQAVRRWSEEIFSLVAENRLPCGWHSASKIQLLRISLSNVPAAKLSHHRDNSKQRSGPSDGWKGGPPCHAFNARDGCNLPSGHEWLYLSPPRGQLSKQIKGTKQPFSIGGQACPGRCVDCNVTRFDSHPNSPDSNSTGVVSGHPRGNDTLVQVSSKASVALQDALSSPHKVLDGLDLGSYGGIHSEGNPPLKIKSFQHSDHDTRATPISIDDELRAMPSSHAYDLRVNERRATPSLLGCDVRAMPSSQEDVSTSINYRLDLRATPSKTPCIFSDSLPTLRPVASLDGFCSYPVNDTCSTARADAVVLCALNDTCSANVVRDTCTHNPGVDSLPSSHGAHAQVYGIPHDCDVPMTLIYLVPMASMILLLTYMVFATLFQLVTLM